LVGKAEISRDFLSVIVGEGFIYLPPDKTRASNTIAAVPHQFSEETNI
jgi:hypothetical protein